MCELGDMAPRGGGCACVTAATYGSDARITLSEKYNQVEQHLKPVKMFICQTTAVTSHSHGQQAGRALSISV